MARTYQQSVCIILNLIIHNGRNILLSFEIVKSIQRVPVKITQQELNFLHSSK